MGSTRSNWTASVSPGAAPSTKNGPVCGLPPSVICVSVWSQPPESTHHVRTVSPLSTRRTGSCEPIGMWKCVGSKSCVATRQHLLQVLVAAAAEADEDIRLFELARARERVRRLQCGDDPLGARQRAERVERFLVGRADVFGPAAVAEERVLRADARV